MNEWLRNFFAGWAPKGVTSRRLIAVTVGSVLLLFINAGLRTATIPEIPASVLVLVALLVGANAITPSP